VFAALKHQVSLADNACQILESKTKQLVPDVDKLHAEVAQLQRQTEKLNTAKLDSWEKFHTGVLSGEGFQHEFEKADDQISKNTDRIPELLEQINRLKSNTGRENVFVEQYDKLSGLQEPNRKVVEDFIAEIKVYSPERIEVVFNSADKYEKIAPLLDKTKPKKKAKA